MVARTLADALRLVEGRDVSAAVLDFGLGDSASAVCGHLRERGIPFMFYTGHGHVQGSYPDAVVVEKPASGNTLLTAMAALGVRPTEAVAAAV